MADSTKFTDKLAADRKRAEEKRKSMANGGGPFAKIFIFIIKDVFYDILFTTFYNMVIDILADSFAFVDDMFFSDFKGILAGKFKSKKGMCFEYTYFRYFITIMIPPMGIFLSRGITSMVNIAICAFLCMINYYPGLIYSFIVIQTAPYANHYANMKRDKLLKAKNEAGSPEESADAGPLFFFGLTMVLVIVGIFIAMTIDPNAKYLESINNVAEYIAVGSSSFRQQQQYR